MGRVGSIARRVRRVGLGRILPPLILVLHYSSCLVGCIIVIAMPKGIMVIWVGNFEATVTNAVSNTKLQIGILLEFHLVPIVVICDGRGYYTMIHNNISHLVQLKLTG